MAGLSLYHSDNNQAFGWRTRSSWSFENERVREEVYDLIQIVYGCET